MIAEPRARIGVSACLLGERVRYDGNHKRDVLVCDTLSQDFELIPVCPEAEAGLGVPRPPVQLVGDARHPRVRGVENPGLDVTASLEVFCDEWVGRLQGVSGFVLKARSPSCGLIDTPLFDLEGQIQSAGPGVFARILQQRHPQLPVVDENDLHDLELYRAFVVKVRAYRAH